MTSDDYTAVPRLPHRFVALTCWAAVALCLATVYLGLKAVNFNFDAMGDPLGQIGLGEAGATAIKWSMVRDIFGFYLLCVPAALYLWFLYRDEHPFAISLATIAGLFYILIGAIGAGILSILWPALALDYAQAGDHPISAEVSAALYKAVTNMVYTGMWGRVEYFLNAVWYWGAAWVAWRRLRAFAVWSLIGSCGAFLAGLGELFTVPDVTEIGMDIYIVSGIVWLAWVGVLAWKQGGTASTQPVAATIRASAS